MWNILKEEYFLFILEIIKGLFIVVRYKGVVFLSYFKIVF